jgi:putative transposase
MPLFRRDGATKINRNDMDAIKFQNKYRIPSARAEWHDYNGGVYFITICTAGREHYFGRIENDRMQNNPVR